MRRSIALTIVVLLLAAVGLLTYIAFMKEDADDRERIQGGIAQAVLQLSMVGSWQTAHYASSDSFALLHDLEAAVPELRALDVLDKIDLTRGVYVRTPIDNQAYLAEVALPEFGIECATYQRWDETLGTNEGRPLISRVRDMRGWPDDLAAIQCRRTRFPWPFLHWTGMGSLSDDMTVVFRAMSERLERD